ncbi:MAG: HK97 family phage major capsid protein, partial [Gammaproteobacteria bacterium]
MNTHTNFAHFGEYLAAVRSASSGHMDPRLGIGAAPASTTTAREAVGTDGGFLVPTEFAADLGYRIFSDETLAGHCRQVPLTSGEASFPTHS